MSYPKNTSSPRPVQAKVVNASDGSPITTGVVAYHVTGSTRAAVAGTAAAHIANGLWTYTPTQAETNYNQFTIEFYHADAVSDGPMVEVVTDASSGDGVYACTWTVNDGSTALEGAKVSFWSAGVLKGTGTTGAAGTVSMSLDAATYTVAISLSGYTFASTTHTVSATASTWTKTFSMTTVSLTPSDPDKVTIYWTVTKSDGTTAGASAATVYIRLYDGPGTAGGMFGGGWRTASTNASGVAQFTNAIIGASYKVKLGANGIVFPYTVPSTSTPGGTVAAGEIVGNQSGDLT